MESVNEVLVISLKQDIQVLNKTIESISGISSKTPEIRSWLFPSKKYQFVTDYYNEIHEDILTVNNLKLFLELVVDRLYVGISLILNHIEDNKQAVKVEENRFIWKPKHVTLGCSFQALWKALSEQKMSTKNSETATQKYDNINAATMTKETQTDIISLNKCDSCSSAMLCMRNLLKSFENEDGDGHIKRKLIRPKLFNITQFGCMLQTTKSIESSLNTLLTKLSAKEEENETLDMENRKLKSEITEKFGKITLLEREVEIFKEKYENDASKLTILSSENQELNKMKSKCDFQIKTLEAFISNLNACIKTDIKKIQKLTQEKSKTENLFKGMLQQQMMLMKLNSSICKNIHVIEDEHTLILNSLVLLDNAVDNINNKLNNISKNTNAVEIKVKKFTAESSEVSKSMVSKLTEFNENIKLRILANCYNNAKLSPTAGASTSTFQIKGNPMEDISKQIEENNEKIRVLQNENKKLEHIVSKFSGFKK